MRGRVRVRAPRKHSPRFWIQQTHTLQQGYSSWDRLFSGSHHHQQSETRRTISRPTSSFSPPVPFLIWMEIVVALYIAKYRSEMMAQTARITPHFGATVQPIHLRCDQNWECGIREDKEGSNDFRTRHRSPPPPRQPVPIIIFSPPARASPTRPNNLPPFSFCCAVRKGSCWD
jgi:hypothetical protein